MDESEHDGDVAVRTTGQPARIETCARIVSKRADVDDIDPGVSNGLEMHTRIVMTDATSIDLHVASIGSAEEDDTLAMLGHLLCGRRLHCGDIGVHADNVRNQHLCRGERIGVDRICITAKFLKETVDLALGVVKAARTRPAI
jgi:hypothetical protein